MNEEQIEILEEIVSDLGALRDRLEALNNNVDDSGLNSAFCLLGKEFIHLRHKIDGNELILCEYQK